MCSCNATWVEWVGEGKQVPQAAAHATGLSTWRNAPCPAARHNMHGAVHCVADEPCSRQRHPADRPVRGRACRRPAHIMRELHASFDRERGRISPRVCKATSPPSLEGACTSGPVFRGHARLPTWLTCIAHDFWRPHACTSPQVPYSKTRTPHAGQHDYPWPFTATLRGRYWSFMVGIEGLLGL